MSNLSPGTHSFTADGVRQVYHVAGAGPVMITQSGGPGMDYAYLRDPLLETRFTMVYPELPGTGASGPLPAGATFVDSYVDFLGALIEHLGVPRVHLLGHSHGGFIAQGFALRHPGRVAGLALYSSSPTTVAEFWADVQAGVEAYAERNAGNPELGAVLEALGSFDAAETDEEVTKALRGSLPLYFADFWGRRAEFEPFRQAVRCWVTRLDDNVFDYRAELASITVPTVVLTGRYDFICAPKWSEVLHRGIPGSRLVILEDSGHFGSVEEPEAFRDAMTWLLDGPHPA
jgi:proline iminopeptidase